MTFPGVRGSSPGMAGRPRISWSDLRERRVGVWGFGREGNASLRKLRSMGIEPVLVDDSPADGPADAERCVLRTDDGGLEALLTCDVVVKTPGISRYRPEADRLRDAGVSLTGGLALWLAEADTGRVVVVTGTKGKSTTSSIIGHLLNGLGYRAAVGGNIGNVPYDPGGIDPPQTPPADGVATRPPVPPWWVIEVSSYQATDLAVTPPVTAVTSLHPDHLPWHGGVEQYYRDKLSACSQPGARITVANGDSDLIRERMPLLGPKVRWVSEDDEPAATWMEPLGLPGRHNRRNALIARQVLRALGIAEADDEAALRAAAKGYVGLPSRLATIGTAGGVTFVDDSLSTNVLPTLAALEAFPGRRVALIVGGQDRGIDYGELAPPVLNRPAPTRVLTLPDSGPRISAAFRAAISAAAASAPAAAGAPVTSGAPSASGPSAFAGVTDCAGLDEAVAEGFEWARPDGVVLLSPAAPSFGHFKNYAERAEAFARAMEEIRAAGQV